MPVSAVMEGHCGDGGCGIVRKCNVECKDFIAEVWLDSRAVSNEVSNLLLLTVPTPLASMMPGTQEPSVPAITAISLKTSRELAGSP
jgi:hypothetical protein